MKENQQDNTSQPTDNTEVMEVDLTSETLPTTKQPLMNGVSSTRNVSKNFELILQNSTSSSLDIDSFLSKCRDSFVESYKSDRAILMQNINKSILSATNTLHQTERSAQNLINFITSKRSALKMSANCNQQNSLVKTYCKNTVTNNVHSTSILNSNRKDVTGDGLEILSTVTSIPKANLPPAGELIRSPLEINTRVWAMKTNLLNVWVRGTITSIHTNSTPENLYKVRLDSQKFIRQKFYNAKQLAYENPASVIVPVGTRIIARYTYSAGRSAHYAGIVAEPPKVINLTRYLIFFDDGSAQYVTHEDIYMVCVQSNNVADDCHEYISDFVRGYLQQYPERPMVKLKKDEFVKTEYNSEWSDAKVLEVDCSMVKVKFLTSQRIQWIYRGSTRLKPLRNELAADHAKSHIPMAPKKRGPKVGCQSSGGSGAAPRKKKEKSDHPSRKSTSHSSSNKKEQAAADSNVKVKKEKELDDAAYARQLQAEEWNFRPRTSRKIVQEQVSKSKYISKRPLKKKDKS